jgi:hypothetical protein
MIPLTGCRMLEAICATTASEISCTASTLVSIVANFEIEMGNYHEIEMVFVRNAVCL